MRNSIECFSMHWVFISSDGRLIKRVLIRSDLPGTFSLKFGVNSSIVDHPAALPDGQDGDSDENQGQEKAKCDGHSVDTLTDLFLTLLCQ